jgi:hypothetical protein
MAQLRKIWTGGRAARSGPHRGPDPGPSLAGTPEPVWGQSCPQNVNRKSTIEQFPAETTDRYPLHVGSGRSGAGNRLKVPGRARARGMDRDGRAF